MSGHCERPALNRRSTASGLEAGTLQSETTKRSHSYQKSRWVVLACLGAPLITGMLCACTRNLECSGSDVQAALKQALDNLYAETRTIAQVNLSIKDIISIGPAGRRIACKALIHLDVNSFGRQVTADPVIPYTAEITDSGQILVVASP